MYAIRSYYDVHDKSQIVFNHLLAGLEITAADQPCLAQLLFRRQQRPGTDLIEVNLRDILDQAAFCGRQIAQRLQKAFAFRGAAP